MMTVCFAYNVGGQSEKPLSIAIRVFTPTKTMNTFIRTVGTLYRVTGTALLVSAGLSSPAHAEAEAKRWVHGSWVNARSTASTDSTVIDHLTTNTPVLLRSENARSCEVSWTRDGREARGFVPCKFLGDRLFTLAEVANETRPDGATNSQYSPVRAFWLAPSMDALFWAGRHFQSTLLSPPQYQLETGQGDNQSGVQPRLLRFPVPEFDAMKAVLAAGIVAAVDRAPPLLTCEQMQAANSASMDGNNRPVRLRHSELYYPGIENYPHLSPAVSDCRVPQWEALRLPDAWPSLFRSSKELLPGSADIERISAHFGIIERGRTVGAPKWERDDEVMRYTGAWDIGSYELALDKSVVEHVIGRTGLVGAYQWTPRLRQTPFGPSQGCAEGLQNKRMGRQVLPGYPSVKDALMWFQAPAALPFKTAAVKARVERAPQSAQVADGQIKRVAIYEIDLDGDHIPDFVQWDIWGTPEISGPDPLLTRREVFVNINGHWYPFEADSYGECT